MMQMKGGDTARRAYGLKPNSCLSTKARLTSIGAELLEIPCRELSVRKSPGFHGVHLVVVIVRYIFEKPSPSSPEIASNKREAADPGVGGLDNVESQSVFDSPTQPRCALAWARQRSWIAEREILSEVWRIFSPSLPSCISRPFALFHISDSRYIFRKPGSIAQTSNFSRVVHSFALVY